MAVSAMTIRDPIKDCYDPQCSCPNKKEIVLHNQHVSRLSRIELENRFLHVYEDNIRLKTDCNHLRDQLKRLSTRVFRLIESRKSLPLHGAGGFERQALNAEMLLSEQAQHIATLQAENEIWRSKVDAMRQQFLSCRSFACCKPKNSRKYTSSRHEQWYLEEEIERLKENLHKMEKTVGILRNGGDPDDTTPPGSSDKRKGKGKAKSNQSPHRGELSKTDLEEQRARIDSDVELIKAKRMLMVQAQQMSTLKEQATKIEQELTEKQQALEEKKHECDELNEQVKKNNDKIAELQGEITELRQYEQKVKDLAEQIHDLKLERDELKAHNSQLLQLSTAAIGSSRSVANEDSTHKTGESLAALQQRLTSLEAALGKEKEERLTVEATKEEERLQIAQLRQKNEELTTLQKELQEHLQAEKIASATAAAHKKEAENVRALKEELESKCQILEDKLKEKEKPCSRCLQLEKELESAKSQERKPLEEIYNFASAEEEDSIVDLLRKFQRFQEQGGSPSTPIDLPPDSGDIPTRRYPTLNQTRLVLGLPKTKSGDEPDVTASSEAGQGDHQRSPNKHIKIGEEDSQPKASVSGTSVPTNVSHFPPSAIADRIAAGSSAGIQNVNDPKLLFRDHESDSILTQTAQMGNEGMYLETARELEKCQELLRVQQNINVLYRNEIDALAKEVLQHTGKYMNGQDI